MKIFCELPNASENINGVRFSRGEGGMISEEIEDAIAEQFFKIPGYSLVPGEEKPKQGEGEEGSEQDSGKTGSDSKTSEDGQKKTEADEDGEMPVNDEGEKDPPKKRGRPKNSLGTGAT
jgi:hypothetical protein